MRTRMLWNRDWEFWCDASCGADLPEGDIPWQAVTLPHDAQIWHAEDLYQDGTLWYRKRLRRAGGERCCLYFEGVYMDAAVFVNGSLAAEWKYGYSSFQADITAQLREGDNQVLVRCCLRHPNSRWYAGAGIYRDVWLLTYPRTHLVTDGLYVSCREQEADSWQVSMLAEAEHAQPGDSLHLTLRDPDGAVIAEADSLPDTLTQLAVHAPLLWDLDTPHCYRLRAELLRAGTVLDMLETVCGFRTLALVPGRGLLLNHRPVVLRGVALHHDLGCLGAAFSLPAVRRQLRLMQEMGANALRTAHNMPAPGVMALCDEMGILVVDEAFDCWEKSKTPYDYARFFPDWQERDVSSWVRRDRNHPSLLFWSVGNEIYDTHRDARGRETLQRLLSEVRQHDPLGNGLTTLGSNYMAWENTQACAGLLDAVGYNYGESLYEAHHAAHPDWMLYGSETASVVQSRGIYHFPLSRSLLVDDDLQCSSLGNSRTSWGAASHEACLASETRYPYTLGQFLWSGIDYLGEPTPYHTRSSYLGLVDTAGFPKDAYYIYQAGWHTWQERPVLHLLPYWDFNIGQKIDVSIISNLPAVELFVNGISQGRRQLRGGADIRADWQVPFAPGELRAVGYDAAGAAIRETVERSFGDAAALRITADRHTLSGSGRDLVFCTVTALDAAGNPVRNAGNRIFCQVSGALALTGLDNGNSADPDGYKVSSRCLFSGMLLVTAAGIGSGTGTIRVTSPGLAPAELTLTVLPAEEIFPILPQIRPADCTPEIPVRKIELTAQATILTPEAPAARIRARLLPSGADAQELRWRVTDDRGITVENVTLEAVPGDPFAVLARGAGDGEVRIRCSCGLLLSDLELTVSGMGSLCLDPYGYVSAGLYDHSHAEIGNGNERGIATSRTEMSWVAYDRLDFGPAGADTLTIDVFEMAGVPTPIRFWKGIPYAPGSRMIGQRIYDRPTTWNVYKLAEFTLEERLTGRDILGIELQCKVHIRGFSFRSCLTWERIPAVSCGTIYGDSYTLQPGSVDHIGNNVSLVFPGLDFGPAGCTGITITGRSALDNNTIHLLFASEAGKERRIVEFPGSADWHSVTFPLAPVTGRQDVTFLFLPGCDFDFRDLQFLQGRISAQDVSEQMQQEE